VLGKWLAPLSLAEFEGSILGRQAWARPGAALDEAKSFGFRELGRILQATPAPDVLVVAGGRERAERRPRSLLELRLLMARGVGICVRHAEWQSEALTRLAEELGACLNRNVHVQLFATAGNTHGFTWHYDAEEVFIVQTAGSKDYYFRENTVDKRVPDGRAPDFSRVRQEVSPLQTARLVAGDCLYIPARWWHMARAREDSLSISLGASEATRRTARLRSAAT
jgi:hypothetical protein